MGVERKEGGREGHGSGGTGPGDVGWGGGGVKQSCESVCNSADRSKHLSGARNLRYVL